MHCTLRWNTLQCKNKQQSLFFVFAVGGGGGGYILPYWATSSCSWSCVLDWKAHQAAFKSAGDCRTASILYTTICISVNPLTAGAAYIRVYIYYLHIKYHI